MLYYTKEKREPSKMIFAYYKYEANVCVRIFAYIKRAHTQVEKYQSRGSALRKSGVTAGVDALDDALLDAESAAKVSSNLCLCVRM